jgi:23S rRNA (uracil1939-C5)-methyltransferase
MKQGDIIELETEKISSDGSCLARSPDGLVIFVPGALPGETVRAKISLRKKEYAVADLQEVLNPSNGRRAAPCPIYGRCGGCQLQHAGYGLQLELKRAMALDAFRRIYRSPFPEIGPCAPSPSEWNYRNKTSLPVGGGRNRFAMGYYARRSHDIVPVKFCPVLDKRLEFLPEVFYRELSKLNLPAWDEKTGRGLLRHLILRSAGGSGEVLASLVVGRRFSSGERKRVENAFLPSVKSSVGNLHSLTANYNFSKGNVILGSETEVLYGDGFIHELMPPLRFKYDTTAFFQINSEMASMLYREARRMALEGGARRILELYSGVGTLSCFLAEGGAFVTAVEEWAPAAALMKENAALNGLSDRLEVFSGKAEKTPAFAAGGYDAVVVDPPRSGCGMEVLDSIGELSPERIVYVSCNPATLARDGAILLEKGYRPVEIRCFDMFPQTVHVETAVLFQK